MKFLGVLSKRPPKSGGVDGIVGVSVGNLETKGGPVSDKLALTTGKDCLDADL